LLLSFRDKTFGGPKSHTIGNRLSTTYIIIQIFSALRLKIAKGFASATPANTSSQVHAEFRSRDNRAAFMPVSKRVFARRVVALAYRSAAIAIVRSLRIT